MKVSQLKETIRTKVRESLTVKTGGRTLTPQQQSQQIDQIKRTTGDQTAGSLSNPVNFVKENEYSVDKIKKMGRSELISFLGLTREEAAKWSDTQLQGAARQLADDSNEHEINEEDYIDDDDVSSIQDDFTDYADIYEYFQKQLEDKK
jgi:hypothetical protein